MNPLKYEIMVEKNLESLDNIELILLKGHLIIEQLINELLELNLNDPKRLRSINLMFSKKLDIYLAIEGNVVISKRLEKVLKELNSLRNKLAHNLNDPVFNTLLVSWVEKASQKKIISTNDKNLIKEQLILSISYIAAFLSGAIEVKKNY